MKNEQRKVTLKLSDYERILALMESDPVKAKSEMQAIVKSGIAADFYETHGKVTFGEIAAKHAHMDARRLPILLEAWGIIRPFYNPERQKQFRYYRVNAELIGKNLEDSFVRGLCDPNELNSEKEFIDADGKIHRMKLFTEAGADFVSDLLVKRGYPLLEAAAATEPELVKPVYKKKSKAKTIEQEPESDAISFNAVDLAGLALVISEVVPLNGLRSMVETLKRVFNNVRFDFNSDDLFNADKDYIEYDKLDGDATMIKRGSGFYSHFNANFQEGGAFANPVKKDLAERIQKAMTPIMEGWV